GILVAGICGIFTGDLSIGIARLRGATYAGVRTVGDSLHPYLGGVGLVDISADGNASDTSGWIDVGRRRVVGKIVVAVSFLLVFCLPASAHNGPPFPIITDQRVGPCVVSLWTHPDLGTGTFWIMVDPPPGGTVPGDLKFQIG